MKSKTLLPFFPAIVAAEMGAGPGPYPNGTFYASANANPNATGSVFLEGLNMANPTNTLQPKLWTASINVTSVPNFPGSSNSSSTITNSVISLDARGNFISNSSSWDTCAIVMQSVAINATVKGQNDNGNCSATLGIECANAWTRAIARSRQVAATSRRDPGDGACGGMTFPDVPDECMGSLNSSLIATDINNSNVTARQALFYNADMPHNVSNHTPYEVAATRIWPILLVQSPRRDVFNGSGATSVGLSCLRATNFTPGSEEIGDVPGAGSRMGYSVWGLVGMMTMMAFAL
ncbi:uncharacterized protein PAC_19314 [Phialocephala subalpina]|uniref:Uncharacterized protein n=1 Tax=Phialocephala subalpina TaxID=576137 RepID=A0A1L7XWK0_9HELO|nr:uncharacterized protein PAC_19314 [Phialocephala subalpina]